ncbi:MAG: prepilin-type N-terminal cleavage/methylation domain-containing protein [Alphaproteobacteria bacterium]|nr:prepilin-type N-terminal cleavage/methylation domain-containing protein [Alphaproteobacteria bacterium]
MKRAFSLVELSIVILIIGVLIAAVGQGLDLLGEAKIKAARVLTTSSYVNKIDRLSLWLETTKEESFDKQYSSGDAIATWKDTNSQSSSGTNFTPASGSVIYTENVFNGLPALYFNGGYLASASIPFGQIFSSDQSTIFMVMKNMSVATVQSSAVFMSDDVSRFNIHAPWSNGMTYFDFGSTCCSDSLSRTIVTAPSGHSSAPVIWSFIKTQSSAKIFFNGALQTTNNGATSTLNLSATATLQIMPYWNAITAGTPAVYIAEIIIFAKALNTRERQAVEKYLSKKYAIKLG